MWHERGEVLLVLPDPGHSAGRVLEALDHVVVDLVHRLAALGDDLPAVAELDLNPVLGFPDRAVAVDARVRISRPVLQRREKSW